MHNEEVMVCVGGGGWGCNGRFASQNFQKATSAKNLLERRHLLEGGGEKELEERKFIPISADIAEHSAR